MNSYKYNSGKFLLGCLLVPFIILSINQGVWAQRCPIRIFCADWDQDNDDMELVVVHPDFNLYPISQVTIQIDGFPIRTYDRTRLIGSGGDTYAIYDIWDMPCNPHNLMSGTLSYEFENGAALTCEFTNGRWDEYDNYDCPSSVYCHGNMLRTQFESNYHNAGLNNIHLYFDLNGPNGNYGWNPLQPEPLPDVFEYSLGFACAPIAGGPDLTITYDTGLKCVYEDGQLCESCEPGGDESSSDPSCVDWLRSCRRDVVKLINEQTQLSGCDQWIGDCGAQGKIYRMGKVGIGSDISSVPAGYHLAVQDGILTQRSKISPCSDGWCDYVFEPDYELVDLCGVESYIEQYGHLPGMPSAQEVSEQKGIELGDMTKRQQVKIEEIFLHLIALDTKFDQLEQAIK